MEGQASVMVDGGCGLGGGWVLSVYEESGEHVL